MAKTRSANFHVVSNYTGDLVRQIDDASSEGRYVAVKNYKNGEITCSELYSLSEYMRFKGFETTPSCDRKQVYGKNIMIQWRQKPTYSGQQK